MLSCLALIAALTACEDGTSPDVDEVVAITSSSPAFTPHPREDGDGHVISGEGTVVVGDSLRLIAADGAGNELEAKWSSSAPEVADVSSAGLVRGLSPGEAMITAETRSRRASARITVLPRSEDPPAPPPPPAVVAVEIRPDSVELSVGDTIGLVATARDSAGNVLSDRPVEWTSADVDVASISADGLVTATGPGTTQITAAHGAVSASATIRVVPPPSPPVTGPLPVFPGAEGAGTTTPAGRGGRVIRVTNLNDSGPGSLREALSANGPRIVIFDVAGEITLRSNLTIRNPYLTLAGQTAPSPGITLRGATLIVATHDVLIQHIRVRVGDDPSGPSPGSRDGIRLLGSDVHNVVIDHVSTSWSIDELISTYDHRDVTIRNSIFSEGLSRSIHPDGEHSKGVFIAEGSHRLTLVGNLIAHNRDRNPALKGNTSAVIVNNVIYNWGNGAAIPIWDSNSDPTGKPVLASVVGNVFLNGPDTPSRAVCLKVYRSVARGTAIYLRDNLWAKAGSDPWSIAESEASFDVRAESPPVWAPLTVRPSHEVEAWVLATAGARPADRDGVDERIIQEVRTRTGRIIDSPAQAGGWPSLARKTRALELPENPNEVDPATGYTKIELWLHKLAAEVEGR